MNINVISITKELSITFELNLCSETERMSRTKNKKIKKKRNTRALFSVSAHLIDFSLKFFRYLILKWHPFYK